MIVKNEEENLPRALESVAGISDELVIVDTGSTDRTVAIAEAHGARVLHEAWSDDYAAARNVGVEAARGDFILYIDADEELRKEDAPALRTTLESGHHDVVILDIASRIGDGDKTNTVQYPRVFRRYADARFRYRLHEQIWESIAHHQPRVLSSEFLIIHHGYALSGEAYRDKCERNLALASRIVEAEPDNGFYLYHVGLGHLTLGRSEEGIRWLEKARRAGYDKPGCLNALAQAHQDRGQSQEAVQLFRESARRCSSQHHAWAALGDLYLKQQDYHEAESAFGQCLAVVRSEIHNDLAQPASVLWMKRGMAQLMMKDAVAAASSLRRALELQLPDSEKRAVAERYLALATKLGSGQM